MWYLIVSVSGHFLSFYFRLVSEFKNVIVTIIIINR